MVASGSVMCDAISQASSGGLGLNSTKTWYKAKYNVEKSSEVNTRMGYYLYNKERLCKAVQE